MSVSRGCPGRMQSPSAAPSLTHSQACEPFPSIDCRPWGLQSQKGRCTHAHTAPDCPAPLVTSPGDTQCCQPGHVGLGLDRHRRKGILASFTLATHLLLEDYCVVGRATHKVSWRAHPEPDHQASCHRWGRLNLGFLSVNLGPLGSSPWEHSEDCGFPSEIWWATPPENA